MLRELHVVDVEELKRASDEEPFVRRLRAAEEASILLVAAAGNPNGSSERWLPRDHAIIIGHYALRG